MINIKQRLGFVSNSSSSSFLIIGIKLKESDTEQTDKIYNKIKHLLTKEVLSDLSDEGADTGDHFQIITTLPNVYPDCPYTAVNDDEKDESYIGWGGDIYDDCGIEVEDFTEVTKVLEFLEIEEPKVFKGAHAT